MAKVDFQTVNPTYVNTVKPNNSSANSAQTESGDNKKMSTTAKYMIGATALAAVTIAAIALSKNIKTNKITDKLSKQFKEDVQKIETFPTEKIEKAGSTVQETIDNVLGKGTKIKAHDYDISQEYPAIRVYRNQGGYKDGCATTKGIQTDCSKQYVTEISNASMSTSPCDNGKVIDLCSRKGISIYKGTVKDMENKVVRFEMNDPDGEGTFVIFSIVSPNDKYTPVQRDLLKLAEHPEKIDTNIFDTILKFKPGYDANGKLIFENLGKYENLDYDLLLSAIQSMAK